MTFESTHGAIALENAVQEAQVKGRLIGTPESLSAACGLSLKTPQAELPLVQELIRQLKLEDISRVYEIIQEERRVRYQEIGIEENKV